jgi:SAM-dependent methyltransferase
MKNIYIPTPSSTLSPKWTKRNKRIADEIPEQMSILDLGCGSKDLLNYLNNPKKYIGIDYNQPLADIQINFNNEFVLPKGEWNYIVCSGLLEYLLDLDYFFKQIKFCSKFYIFTFFTTYSKRSRLNNPNEIESITEFEGKLSSYFEITKVAKIKEHNIYVCKDM